MSDSELRHRYREAVVDWLDQQPGESLDKGDALLAAASALVNELDRQAGRPLEQPRRAGEAVAHTGV